MMRFLNVVAVLAVSVIASHGLTTNHPALGASTYWQHDPNGVGDWFDPNNWTLGLPSVGDVACIDNGGTAEIADNMADVYFLKVAEQNQGTLIHSGGSARAYGLSIGYLAAAVGQYQLTGSAALSTDHDYIGDAGSGTFTQTGGMHEVGELAVGYNVGSTGQYELSGSGLLWVRNNERIGHMGTGSFTQTDGAHYIDATLFIGMLAGSNGTYNLGGSAHLSADEQNIGLMGQGSFIQTGGVNETDGLYLAVEPGSSGTYQLDAGELETDGQCVGNLGNGTFTQTGGSNETDSLCIGADAGSVGLYQLGGAGQLRVNGDLYLGCEGTGTFNQDGGVNTVTGSLHVGCETGGAGSYTISAGTLNVGGLYLGCETTGTLDVADPAAQITISEKLHFGPNAAFTAAAGSSIHIANVDLQNASTDPNALAGLNNLELIYESGDYYMGSLELASQDVGATTAGLFGNFALHALTLGSDGIGRVRLVDDYDNCPGTDVQYVKYLTVSAGSFLDLNGHVLYYGVLLDDAGTIVENGGSLVRIDREGDVDMNGTVDGLDLTAILSNWSGSDPTADLDANGTVDGLDLTAVLSNWTSAAVVPEPTSVTLLALGGLVLIRRQRA